MREVVVDIYRDDRFVRRARIPGEQIRLGRSPDAELSLGDEALAPLHATISWEGSRLVCRPLAGRVRVNGAPVETVELHDGDVVELGSYRIDLRLRRSSPEDGAESGSSQDHGERVPADLAEVIPLWPLGLPPTAEDLVAEAECRSAFAELNEKLDRIAEGLDEIDPRNLGALEQLNELLGELADVFELEIDLVEEYDQTALRLEVDPDEADPDDEPATLDEVEPGSDAVDRLEVRERVSAAALLGVTRIRNNLLIGPGPADGLGALRTIERVGGDVIAAQLEGVVDLQGLDGIRRIRGDFTLYDNYGLRSASLPRLGSVSGEVRVVDNNQLAKIRLGRLSAVGVDLRVVENDVLRIIELPQMLAVKGDLNIDLNPQLGTVHLPSLTTIRGSLRIMGNGAVRQLRFPSLTAVGGDIRIFEEERLASLLFPRLRTVRGDVRIGFNRSLKVVSLPRLKSVGGKLSFGSVPQLADLRLPQLSHVGGQLAVLENRKLIRLDLPELSVVAGDLVAAHLERLMSLRAQRLGVVGGALVVRDNRALNTLNLSRLSLVGTQVKLRGNQRLSNHVVRELRDQLVANGFTGDVDIG